MNARMIGEGLARAVVVFVLATVVLGVAYPFAVGAVGQLAFPWQANGSVIEVDGVKYGSQLVGQPSAT